jgi:hypothetical protein
MVTLATTEPQLRLALNTTETALRRLAEYELDPAMAQRLDELSEKKEFLDENAHAELLALVDFARRRTVEKLEARLALEQLHAIVPEMVSAP